MNSIRRLFQRKKLPESNSGLPIKETIQVFGGCGHPGPRKDLEIRIFGYPATVFESPSCAACTEVRFNECSTHCAGCKYPIIPGEPVAASWVDAAHPYTHMSSKCGNPDFYAGVWGAGVLIGLEELHPGIFGPKFINDLLLDKS